MRRDWDFFPWRVGGWGDLLEVYKIMTDVDKADGQSFSHGSED